MSLYLEKINSKYLLHTFWVKKKLNPKPQKKNLGKYKQIKNL